MKRAVAPCLAVFLGACGGQTSVASIGSLHDEAGIGTMLDGSVDAVADEGSAEPACEHVTQETLRVHTDIFILLDASGSMNCPVSDDACDDDRAAPATGATRWSVATSAIDALLSAPASIDHKFGLALLTSGKEPASCDPTTRAMPRIDIGASGGPAAIADWIAHSSPSGTTPMAPALQGSIEYANAYTVATPNRITVVLLVTDGMPNGCDSTLASTAMVARSGYQGTPAAKTIVLDVGHAPGLDDVALNGSGGVTHVLAPSPDFPDRIEALVRTIDSATTCDFVVPSMTDRSLDYDSAVVLATIDGAPPVPIGRIENAAACTEAGGWYYDVNPPAMPTVVLLCPQSCDLLKRADTSKLELTLACDQAR